MQNLELKHLDQASISQTQLTIDALARIAPSCITEVKDSKTGSIKHAVDFKVLRQLLGDNAVEDAPEAYEFTWVGKQEARREAAKSIHKTLRPVPEDSVDWDNTQNIYIEGDNLEALKLLQKSYLGKVKMIYIDPPYNTGNDFVYHDDFKVGQSEYDEKAGNVDEEGNRLVSRGDNDLDDVFVKNTDSNGRFHSDWCSMIYSRLMIARSLLTEDGMIFISINDDEVENLRKICDDVFGEYNFISTFIWEKRLNRENRKEVSVRHDFVLCYAKQKIENIRTLSLLPMNDKALSNYGNPDNDPRGLWKSDPAHAQAGHGTKSQFYTLTAPNGKKHELPSGRCWLYTEEVMNQAIKDNRIWFGKDGNGVPRIKTYLNAKERGLTPESILFAKDVSTNEKAKNDLKRLFDGLAIFETPKPTELIKFFCEIGTSKNDLIVDFFSGVATTAHAVMQINAEDKGNRRFIMVQIPEEYPKDSEAYKAGYKNICEAGKERIRRAGAKIKEELAVKNKNKNKQQEGGLFDDKAKQEAEESTTLDTGFRVFRIDSGNMKDDLEQAPAAVEQTKLDFYLDNVKDDRTELDLLFGCMLNWGVQLSLPMTCETVDGCNIYTVNDGDLVACLTKDQPVTENIVHAIAEKSPLRVLFRDGSFASDASKINIFEQFKQLMDWSDDEIVKNVRVL